ncbi:MAG: hypothetical protein ACUVRV_07355 [Cyanobacteriota bacterium]
MRFVSLALWWAALVIFSELNLGKLMPTLQATHYAVEAIQEEAHRLNP